MTKFYVAKNGIFEDYADDLFTGRVKVPFPIPFDKERGDEFVHVGDEEEETIRIAFKKMPISKFQQALAIMEWGYKEKKSEVIVCFRYNWDGQKNWDLVVPEQWNGPASVCYHPELHPEEMTRVVGDVHSHPKFASSNHSSTDNLDERKNPGIFIVVKDFQIWTCDPTITGVVRETPFQVNPDFMFSIKAGAEVDVKFPEEWKARIHQTPCDGCKRRTEAIEASKKEQTLKSKYEEEKSARLVPELLVEAWRKAQTSTSPGKEFEEMINAWVRKTQWSAKIHRCGNYECKKLVKEVHCPECKRAMLNMDIAKSLGLAIDELYAHEDVKGKLEVLEDLALSIAKQEKEAAAKTAPASTPAKAEDDTDIIYIQEGTCGEDCRLKKMMILHDHVLAPKSTGDTCKNQTCAEMGHRLLGCSNTATEEAASAPAPAPASKPADEVPAETPNEHDDAQWFGVCD